ncbi:MAG: type II secretion system F family protein [Magnetococcales bacterium]|nr:type II secretion system F family protein [Magnetococcales bacterium]
MVFSVAVVIFILVVVFPQFSTMFQNLGDQLPNTTRFLMGVSELIRAYWQYLVLAMVAALFGIMRWLKSPGGGVIVDRLQLRLPVVREIFVQIYLTQIFRVLGFSLDNGVAMLDAVKATQDLIKNRIFNKFLNLLEANITEGKGFAVGFQETPFIPPLVRQMMATAEETGTVPKVCLKMADFYDRELMKRLSTLSKAIEPIMLVIMGLVVGIIVSSLILPIFKLSGAVG